MECLFHAVESGKQPKEDESSGRKFLSACVCLCADMKTEKTNMNAV